MSFCYNLRSATSRLSDSCARFPLCLSASPLWSRSRYRNWTVATSCLLSLIFSLEQVSFVVNSFGKLTAHSRRTPRRTRLLLAGFMMLAYHQDVVVLISSATRQVMRLGDQLDFLRHSLSVCLLSVCLSVCLSVWPLAG